MLNTNQIFTGNNYFNNVNNTFYGSFYGSASTTSFSGRAGALTGLNASQLTFGTVPMTVLSSLVETNGGGLKVGTNGTAFAQVEAGSATLPTSSTVELTNFLVNYTQPFASTPKVSVSISFGIQAVTDMYATVVSSNSPTAFRVNVMRLDTPTGWGQSLNLNWQAWQ